MKRIIAFIIALVCALLLCACSKGITSNGEYSQATNSCRRLVFNNDGECDWCGSDDLPTFIFEYENGESCAVCEQCASTCLICDEPATSHFTNMLEMETFVCDDCLDDVLSESD